MFAGHVRRGQCGGCLMAVQMEHFRLADQIEIDFRGGIQFGQIAARPCDASFAGGLLDPAVCDRGDKAFADDHRLRRNMLRLEIRQDALSRVVVADRADERGGEAETGRGDGRRRCRAAALDEMLHHLDFAVIRDVGQHRQVVVAAKTDSDVIYGV